MVGAATPIGDHRAASVGADHEAARARSRSPRGGRAARRRRRGRRGRGPGRSTASPKRNRAPAASAASTSRASRTVRRGAYRASTPAYGFSETGSALRAVVERHPPYRRRAGRHDAVQQAPAPQLQHAAAHQRVRRHGVRAAAGPVDDQHPQAGAGEQQRGRGAGDAGTDDDGVPRRIGARRAGGWLGADVSPSHAGDVTNPAFPEHSPRIQLPPHRLARRDPSVPRHGAEALSDRLCGDRRGIDPCD